MEGESFLNPLALHLDSLVQQIFSRVPPESLARIVLQQQYPNRTQLLDALSDLLLQPALTLLIAETCRPILFDLCARFLDKTDSTDDAFVVLCLLIQVHEELYPILLEFLQNCLPNGGPLSYLISGSTRSPHDHQRILLAYYRMLKANHSIPMYLNWPLSPLVEYLAHPDIGIRYLSVRSFALQAGLVEGERENMEKECVGGFGTVEIALNYGQNMSGQVEAVDGWLLPLLEAKRIDSYRSSILRNACDYYESVSSNSTTLSETDLSPRVVNVYGVLMLRSAPPHSPGSILVPTPSAVKTLRRLAICISARVPTLLTSTPSCGKSLMLSHLSECLHPGASSQIVTIHLADKSLEARSLLGSYVSSPNNPGSFEWREGVLVRAMREGKWVVLEDMDRGSNEALGVLAPLVESVRPPKSIGHRGFLDIPNHGRIQAHDSFRLFATRTLQPSRDNTFSTPFFYGAHKFHEIALSVPSKEELYLILGSRYSRLEPGPVRALVHLWDNVRRLNLVSVSREIGLRELDKYCLRVSQLLPSSKQETNIDTLTELDLAAIFPNPTLREEMFLEARDVFFGFGATSAIARAQLDAVAQVVATHLGLKQDRVHWLLQGHTPEWRLENDPNGRPLALLIGQTRLSARPIRVPLDSPTRPFSMHRPAVGLLHRIAKAISYMEPVLLTGETGTGKTSVITHLAHVLNRSLISLNLSHQTETSDLLGGFKPIEERTHGYQLQEQFVNLFNHTFSRKKNTQFEESVRKAVAEGKWRRATTLWLESVRLAKERYEDVAAEGDILDSQTSRKRRKVEDSSEKLEMWHVFEVGVHAFRAHHLQTKSRMTFSFVEGPLVKAIRDGSWVLLDEVNLASSETLECLSSLLEGPASSITLTEQGSLEPIPRHPDFRLFACMNPATDVGKKDLPPNIRSRFTEIDVPSPDSDRETLLSIITQYIGGCAVADKAAILDAAEFYTAVKSLAEQRLIADGSNHRPHYSMRTLTRALTFTADTVASFGLRRALWESCLMAFAMTLDSPSSKIVTDLAYKHLVAPAKNPKSLLARDPSGPPTGISRSVKLGPFFLRVGSEPPQTDDLYVITPSVELKLLGLARLVLTGRFPILIEGPTSSGKTSTIEYLAHRTGHRFVRINNHEHTDIQEYLGTYITDPVTGKLVFREGLLVRALREGHWIVLDELNLAPTDVLEALNRLLDDNRELVIPETQEVVRPHPNFLLFATQNPPGLYAGRKVLSRAFRNRFLEVHFEDVPQDELETILCQRTRIAPSYGHRLVSVFKELQKRRQTTRVFESKQGFATLRDLFRWAERDAIGYQELAENGYMLLAERSRRSDDKVVVKEVIEQIMQVRIDERKLYSFEGSGRDMTSYLGCSTPSGHLVWTSAAQRLFVLVARALRFQEPVLLVGETGTGKTSVCQVYADLVSRHLHSVSCHQNTETADIVGGQRPVRNRTAPLSDLVRESTTILSRLGAGECRPEIQDIRRRVGHLLASTSLSDRDREELLQLARKLQKSQAIFEWHDGPLVQAMRNGELLLLDEISLADDSVLERLNSVLEPSRSLVLAEQGDADLIKSTIRAYDGFGVIATMNPGGDFGKKELSPALRNRFTEIWVPAIEEREDLDCILRHSWRHDVLLHHTGPLLDFAEWIVRQSGDRSLLSLRDLLAWVSFSNMMMDIGGMAPSKIFHHAAAMTYLDGLGTLPKLVSLSDDKLRDLKVAAQEVLNSLLPADGPDHPNEIHDNFSIGPFGIKRGPLPVRPDDFNLHVPTVRANAMRILRASQLVKPVLLEGSPGVGKTSLVSALANAAGYPFHRINLSDQTDLVDLFGSDLPVDGGDAGEFAWKDAEFLLALQKGHWVLLDEMNLAPQSVLEGLNAILDHRGSVFIPELGRSFDRHPNFRVFAAQNPMHQGGGRKGLPKSFMNRFTKVFVEGMDPSDQSLICERLFPSLPPSILRSMILFVSHLNDEVTVKQRFAREGAPWEFNLRDVLRWASLLHCAPKSMHPGEFVGDLFLQRLRSAEDRQEVMRIFRLFFDAPASNEEVPPVLVSSRTVQIGHFRQMRSYDSSVDLHVQALQIDKAALRTLQTCSSLGWLVILTGAPDSGKSSLVRSAAKLTGHPLHEVMLNAATDISDLLGGFEQVNSRDRATYFVSRLLAFSDHRIRTNRPPSVALLQSMRKLRQAFLLQEIDSHTMLTLAEDTLAKLEETPEVTNLRHDLETISHAMDEKARFEWLDGPLVRALREGRWLLLDGANLCNASVLDRLNSLCENDGSLVLSERGHVNGAVQTIRPHPHFRLFMTTDPRNGELSRAMRNRGVEIYMQRGDYAAVPVLQAERITLDGPSGLYLPTLSLELPRRALQKTLTDSLATCSEYTSLEEDSGFSSVVIFDCWLNETDTKGIASFVAMIASLVVHIAPVHIEHLHRLVSLAGDLSLRRLCSTALRTIVDVKLMTLIQDVRSRWDPQGMVYCDVQPLGYIDEVADLTFEVSSCRLKVSATLLDLLRVRALLFVTQAQTQDSEGHSKQHATYTSSHPDEASIVDLVRSLQSQIFDAVQSIVDLISAPLIKAVSSDLRLCWRILLFCSQLQHVTGSSLLDYSWIRTVISSLAELLSTSTPPFREVRDGVLALANLIQTTSGLHLVEIWRAFLPVHSLRHHELHGLNELREHVRAGILPSDLRTQSVNLLAVANVSPSSDTSAWENLMAMVHTLCQSLTQLPSSVSVESVPQRSEDPMLLLHELTVLAHLTVGASSNPDADKLDLTSLIALGCNSRSGSLERFVQYQQLLWASEKAEVPVNLLGTLHANWMEAIWNTTVLGEANSGPLIILRPSQLQETLRLCEQKETSLAHIATHDMDIKRQVTMTLAQCRRAQSREDQLIETFVQAVYLILRCVEKINSEFMKTLASICHTRRHNGVGSVEDLQQLLSTPNLGPTEGIIGKYLSPPVYDLVAAARRNVDLTSRLGGCWVNLAHLLLELYVPSLPVDPSAMYQCEQSHWKYEHELISRELRYHRDLQMRHPESVSTGQDATTAYFVALLQENCQHVEDFSNLPQRAPDTTELTSFWTEVRQFLTQVVSHARIETLEISPRHDTLQQEEIIQASITEILRRLRSTYPQHEDLRVPIELALLYMKFGLRLRHHGEDGGDDVAQRFAMALLQYPSVRSAAELQSLLSSSDQAAILGQSSLLLHLASIDYHVRIGVPLQQFTAIIDRIYEQVYRIWRIQRAKAQEIDIASQSLYRQNTTSNAPMSESEIESREFLELFPDYDTPLAAEDGDRSGDNIVPASVTEGSQMASFIEMHLHLYLPGRGPADSPVDRKTFALTRINSLRFLLKSSILSATLDRHGAVAQLALLHEQQTFDGANALYDIYHDSNVRELQRAALILRPLQSKLRQLVGEWPDQMILQNLLERCERVLGYDLRTSVAKLLAAMEQLLVQGNDWESYANRENSLKAHWSATTALIIEWRRLELSCWPALLAQQEMQCVSGVREWWFRLYEALIVGLPCSSQTEQEGHDSDLDDYLTSVIPLVEEFVTSSPLGQFQARLDLMLSFGAYLGRLGIDLHHHHHHQKNAYKRMTHIVRSLHGFYQRYVPDISASLSRQRSEVEKEVETLVKLASWKDVNVQALKQSAVRSHHQLYKCIRKYRGILRQSAAPFLQTSSNKELKCDLSDNGLPAPYVTPVTEISLAERKGSRRKEEHLLNLSRTLQRFAFLASSRARARTSSAAPDVVDEIAVDIIQATEHLKTLSIPGASAKSRREKLRASIHTRKRKAWQDLLKEMKRLGLSYHLKVDVQERLSDRRWLIEQPILPLSLSANPLARKIEDYVHRIQEGLPRLRSDLSHHHPDLGTRELVRGISILQSGFSMALNARLSLYGASLHESKLKNLIQRLRMLIDDPIIVKYGPEIAEYVASLQDVLFRTVDALHDLAEGLRTHISLSSDSTLSATLSSEVQTHIVKAKDLSSAVMGLHATINLTELPLLLQGECHLLTESRAFVLSLMQSLQFGTAENPSLQYLLQPIELWLEMEMPDELQLSPDGKSSDGDADDVINSLLIVVQKLVARYPDPDALLAHERVDELLKSESLFTTDLTALLDIEGVTQVVASAIAVMAHSDSPTLKDSLSRVMPFIECYRTLVGSQIISHLKWCKSLFKLIYVLFRIMDNVISQGFCLPPESLEEEPGSEGGESAPLDGTGLGEGSGDQNISDQIEDESQIEGLQNEHQEDSSTGEEQDNDAIEMEDDGFEGRMEDVPDRGGDAEDEMSAEEEESLDEQIADIDSSDPSAVDEKLWGDEKGPEDGKEDKTTTGDRSQQSPAKSELVAKGEERAAAESENGQNVQTPPKLDEVNDDAAQVEDDSIRPNDTGAPLDDYVDNANTLDLPEELELGMNDDKSTGSLEGEEDDFMAEDAHPHGSAEDELNEEESEDSQNTSENLLDEHTALDDPGQRTDPSEVLDKGDRDLSSFADVQSGAGDASEHHPQEAHMGGSDTKTSGLGQPEETLDASIEAQQGDTKEVDSEPIQSELQQDSEPYRSNEGSQAGQARSRPGAEQAVPQHQLRNNPLRSLGDAMREIRERFDDIIAGGESVAAQELEVHDESAPLEYTHPDELDVEMQALGPAGEEKAANLNEIQLASETNPIDAAMDIDDPEIPTIQPPQPKDSVIDRTSSAKEADVEGGITEYEVRARQRERRDVENNGSSSLENTAEEIDDEPMEEAERAVEATLRHWQADGQPQDGAEHIWRLYESLTHDLSYALCEQLRLILEPTMATRLKGDYRTGKRLNMKKIIPYIASEYTKDKIWLRRTRPSQREYQVLIALDDSRSMAESHSVHLAYETLALVSKALSRLEVGDIGIVKFGESVDILHGFNGAPFSDQAGSTVMSSFSFNQKATNVLSLLRTSLQVLTDARESRSAGASSAAELWQLMIVISDGICQDHEQLRSVLRRAEEHRVMVVFVIVDALHSNVPIAAAQTASGGNVEKNSILTMNQVAYKNVDGRMEIQMQRYLDTFPFEYYVVLRNVEALPDVLSSTLRQFFERISEQ